MACSRLAIDNTSLDSIPGLLLVLELPNGQTISTKVCRDRREAIMSNPNKDLGINAGIFAKEDEGKYSIDFTKIDEP